MKINKITLILFVLFAGFYLYKQQAVEILPPAESNVPPITTENIQEETNAQLVFTASQSGQTALELLELNAKIKTQDYGEAGKFVTSIDDIASDNQHYWAFYVNDEYAQQGVSQTVLESGDVVKFVYEEISQAEL